jgi:hypothetical protein
MSEQAMALLQKLLASRFDATGAHCPSPEPPPPDEVDGGTDRR